METDAARRAPQQDLRRGRRRRRGDRRPRRSRSRDGEFVCIVGPSGCGKTTLLKCMSGLLEPTSGEVRLDDERVDGPPETMALVFQEYSRSLFPWMTVRQNVAFPLRRKQLDKAQARASSSRRSSRSASPTRSTATRGSSRAACSSAWRSPARSPTSREILLMDEPFASVDAQTRADLEDLVLEVRRQYDITIVFVTHDIDESVYLERPDRRAHARRRRRCRRCSTSASRSRATRSRRRSCRSSRACARTSGARSSARRRRTWNGRLIDERLQRLTDLLELGCSSATRSSAHGSARPRLRRVERPGGAADHDQGRARRRPAAHPPFGTNLTLPARALHAPAPDQRHAPARRCACSTRPRTGRGGGAARRRVLHARRDRPRRPRRARVLVRPARPVLGRLRGRAGRRRDGDPARRHGAPSSG